MGDRGPNLQQKTENPIVFARSPPRVTIRKVSPAFLRPLAAEPFVEVIQFAPPGNTLPIEGERLDAGIPGEMLKRERAKTPTR